VAWVTLERDFGLQQVSSGHKVVRPIPPGEGKDGPWPVDASYEAAISGVTTIRPSRRELRRSLVAASARPYGGTGPVRVVHRKRT